MWHAIFRRLDEVHWFLRRNLACGANLEPPETLGGNCYGWPCSKDNRKNDVEPGSDEALHREFHDAEDRIRQVIEELGKGSVEPTWKERET